ncbi:MAG: DUF1269 domain-containing protein [Nitriliruptor sp.]|nr:MAG: DUF1269 domain-containing protein [Nitriliruptor sp.]
MANLTVWKFPTPTDAGRTVDALIDLQDQGLVNVQDGAIVRWDEGKKRPKTRQLQSLSGAGALNGAFWGMLFGFIFSIPLIGAAAGAMAGGVAGSLADIGIDDDFIRDVRDKVQPGSSALFLLTSGAVQDRIAERFKEADVELIHTNMSTEDEATLREVFGV